MSDLRDLYQQLVLDHGRHPRNKRVIHECEDGAECRHTEGYNPLCGDKLTLYAKARDGVIEDLSFEGEGCAIFTASTSMLTEVLKGRKVEEIRGILDEFIEMLTSGEKTPDPEGLGKLAVFGGVKDFPTRVKCATLPWRALEVILESVDGKGQPDQPIRTE
ncbi:MAG: Fe-S cluster assembly sulfur transfer protein SufU [bacterium]